MVSFYITLNFSTKKNTCILTAAKMATTAIPYGDFLAWVTFA